MGPKYIKTSLYAGKLIIIKSSQFKKLRIAQAEYKCLLDYLQSIFVIFAALNKSAVHFVLNLHYYTFLRKLFVGAIGSTIVTTNF
jgi:hypothetical protein